MRASDLARKCAVTERTIYRDIISISEASIPVYFDGGYKLLHNGFLPPTSLTGHEAGFLTGLLKSPMFLGNKPYHEMIERILDKIESVENPAARDGIVSVGATSTEKTGDNRFASVLEDAIRERRMVTVSYLSLKNEKTTRRIAPYAMTFRRHAWYLVGYCYLRNEIRTFRLGRIQSIEPSREKFIMPEDFSVGEYFRSSWGVYKGQLTRFKVLFSGQGAVAIRTTQHHPDEKTAERPNGKVIYEVAVAGADEFIRWILGFGKDAEIIEPVSARKAMRAILRSTLKKYE